jgi:hypothetical protein
MKVDNLFCFNLSSWNFPNQITLYNAIDIFENLTMNKGALSWVEDFSSYNAKVIDYWTIFSLNFLTNQDWKLHWNLEVFLVLLESLHQVWFNKVDFVILKPKMWTILLNFGWVCIVVENSNKLQKGVWKENSIECIQTWANDIGYISV